MGAVSMKSVKPGSGKMYGDYVTAAVIGGALVALLAVPSFRKLKDRYETYTRNRVKSAVEPLEIALWAAKEEVLKEKEAADKARMEYVKKEAAAKKASEVLQLEFMQQYTSLEQQADAARAEFTDREICLNNQLAERQRRICELEEHITEIEDKLHRMVARKHNPKTGKILKNSSSIPAPILPADDAQKDS